jgi:WD40 repeat protein
MCGQDRLVQLVQDARRFIMYHKGAIEGYPLQTYAAALLFSPTGSLIRQLFRHEEPETISISPALNERWSACLQTLEGHSNYVTSVAFSHDSARLASASYDHTVKIWDASSGACLQTLEGHSSTVSSVAFSHDSARLASASDDHTVKIWDASSSACLQTLEGHSSWVTSVAFSHDSARLASGSGDHTVKIWDASSGACLQTLEGHSNRVRSVAFSHDAARLASASLDNTVKIWDASSGACLQTLEGHSDWITSVAFSHDSARLASASDDHTVKTWDASSGACLQTLEGYGGAVSPAKLVSILVSLHPDKTAIEPQQPVSRGAAISLNSTWVSNNAQDMVWLPREYRPNRPECSAVLGRCVGIGTGLGKVWFCRFL